MTDLRLLLLSAAIANLFGILLIPTFQRVFTRAVISLNANRSLPGLLLRAFSARGWYQLSRDFRIPARENLTHLGSVDRISPGLLLANTVSVALWTVAVFAALYAGLLYPQFRNTAGQLSAVINGVATLLLFLLIDPGLSLLTDDVAAGKSSQAHLRKSVVWFAASRFAGTVVAQFLLVPAAVLIGFLAKHI